MKNKPIEIPPDIAAQYEHEGQGQAFADAFKAIMTVPAKDIPLYKNTEKRAKGRPKKVTE